MTPAERIRDAARRIAGRAARLSPRTILILGWLVFVLYAYPGYMSSDSSDQLLDTRLGTFTDWHPPVMTELWRVIGFALTGPVSLLALQSLLLLIGAHRSIARTLAPRAAAVVACGLLVFPPVMTTMAVIWPDGLLTGLLVAGLAAITAPRRAAQLAGFGLLALASAMRPSAAFAVLPILALGWVWPGARAPGGVRRIALVLAAWAAVWLAAVGLDAALRSKETGRTRYELAAYDLIGTLRYAGRIGDGEVRALLADVPLRGDDLQRRAAAYYAHPERVTSGEDRLFDPPADLDAIDAVAAARRRLALAHPGGYLGHRWRVAYGLLGLRRGPGWNPAYTSLTSSADQADATFHMARHSAVQRGLIAPIRAIAQTPLFRPYLYAALAIVLLAIAVRRRQRLVATLLASGLSYELSLCFVAVETRYALSLWMIAATSLGGALLAIDFVRARRARRAPADPAGVASARRVE